MTAGSRRSTGWRSRTSTSSTSAIVGADLRMACAELTLGEEVIERSFSFPGSAAQWNGLTTASAGRCRSDLGRDRPQTSFGSDRPLGGHLVMAHRRRGRAPRVRRQRLCRDQHGGRGAPGRGFYQDAVSSDPQQGLAVRWHGNGPARPCSSRKGVAGSVPLP
jgi:hypothetical protein